MGRCTLMDKQKIGLVVQARMGSTRLPGKVLMPVGERVLLAHIAARMACVPGVLVIATSTNPENDSIEDFCRREAVPCFRGSEDNVLERYVRCAEHFGFEHIVRLTGDNPFPDASSLLALLRLHLAETADFSTSFEVLPLGVGCEIFTLAALRLSLDKAYAPHHFEHVDEYLLENKDKIRHVALPAQVSTCFPDVRLTVDTPEDMERVRRLVSLGGDMLTTEEALRLCRSL